MRIGFKHMAVMAVLLVATAGSQGLFANCTNFGAGFPIFQCGFVGWFAPAPPAAGAATGAWWQMGYGNRTITNGFGGGGLEGTGKGPLAVFGGNDSGAWEVILTDAQSVLPQYAGDIPAGSTCFLDRNSWGQQGVDGCADNPRTTADNDDILNPYFGPYGSAYCPYDYYRYQAYGYPYGDPAYWYSYTWDRQIDYPIGVVLTEDTGEFFSLACVANKARGTDFTTRCSSTSEGLFDLATVVNGDLNPVTAQNNIIPWQPVPRATVDGVTYVNPGDTANSDRILALSWPNVRLVSDGSDRPSTRADVVDGGVGCANLPDYVRYVLESAPITGATPDPSLLTWTLVQAVPAPVGPTVTLPAVQVPANTALRVRTLLGVVPRTAQQSAANCRKGACGDIGFEATETGAGSCHLNDLICTRGPNLGADCTTNGDADCFPNAVSPPLTIVGGALVSEKAIDTVAAKNKNVVKVTFRTTSELTVDSIDILAVGKKGDRTVKTIACKQCTTGVGDTYDVLLTSGDLKGAKKVKVRLNGPGTTSDSFPVN